MHGRELPNIPLQSQKFSSFHPFLVDEKLFGNDTIILCMFLQVSLPKFAHILWHHIGSHVLYHSFSPFWCNWRHLVESDSIDHHLILISLTSTLSNAFVHVSIHSRSVDPHFSDLVQGLFWREVHVADCDMSTFQVWNYCIFINAQSHDWISFFFLI